MFVKSTHSARSIANQKTILAEQGFVYLETGDPEFDWIKFCEAVTSLDLIPQYKQGWIFSVKSQQSFLNLSDAKSQKTLLPHTEASDYQVPPKYLALWCKQPSACGGGATTLVRISGFLSELSEAEVSQLMQTEYFFGSRNGVHKNRTEGAIAPILSFPDGKLNFRYSYNLFKYGDYSPNPDNLEDFTPDPFVEAIAEKFLTYFERRHFAIQMEQYSLLLWNNQSIAHSRTAYTDPTRELARIFLA
jgi:hypothetical protein